MKLSSNGKSPKSLFPQFMASFRKNQSVWTGQAEVGHV